MKRPKSLKGDPVRQPDGTWLNARGRRICGIRKTKAPCHKKGEGPCVNCVCRQTELWPNGRCKYHKGGAQIGPLNPQWKHGRSSKFFKGMPEHLREAYTASVSDPDIVSVRDEMGLFDARAMELLERLTTGESAVMLAVMARTVTEMADELAHDEVDVDYLDTRVAALRQLLKERARDQATWGELRETVEGRRRLADTERKLLEHKQAVVDVAELRAITAFFLTSIKTHVAELQGGRKAINLVAADIQRLLMPKDGEPPLEMGMFASMLKGADA
jgi:ribosomal protein S15P/S13E